MRLIHLNAWRFFYKVVGFLNELLVLFLSFFVDRAMVAVTMIANTIMMVMLGNSGTVGDDSGELEVPEVGVLVGVLDVGVLEEPEATAVTELSVS